MIKQYKYFLLLVSCSILMITFFLLKTDNQYYLHEKDGLKRLINESSNIPPISPATTCIFPILDPWHDSFIDLVERDGVIECGESKPGDGEHLYMCDTKFCGWTGQKQIWRLENWFLDWNPVFQITFWENVQKHQNRLTSYEKFRKSVFVKAVHTWAGPKVWRVQKYKKSVGRSKNAVFIQF